MGLVLSSQVLLLTFLVFLVILVACRLARSLVRRVVYQVVGALVRIGRTSPIRDSWMHHASSDPDWIACVGVLHMPRRHLLARVHWRRALGIGRRWVRVRPRLSVHGVTHWRTHEGGRTHRHLGVARVWHCKARMGHSWVDKLRRGLLVHAFRCR